MNPILDKIRKLLRLAKNSEATPAEAAVALNKAIAMAEASGIDIRSVQLLDDQGFSLTHHTEKSQAGPAHLLASGIVKRHFGVETLFDSRKAQKVIHFIGLELNCQLASYAYIYTVRSMRAAWRHRKNKRLRDRDAFLRGYAVAIESLMPEAFRNEGLILSATAYRDTVILGDDPNVRMTSLKAPAAKSDRAFSDGWREGHKAGIRNALHGSETPTAIEG